MLKKVTKVNFIYNGEHKIEDTYLKEIKLNWNKYKNNKKYYDGDIYCVDEIINNNIPQVTISKTKYSTLIYAKQTKKIVIRSLFSGSYIKTKDNYVCIIKNNKGVLNLIGGMASNEDFINNTFDYSKCLNREVKEELGINLDNNPDFINTLKYLKVPSPEELKLHYYSLGTIFEVKTNLTKEELELLFKNNTHDKEIKSLEFFNKETYKDLYKYNRKAKFLEELFNLIFKKEE